VSGVSWYQSVPLPGGIVTAGEYDTCAELARVPFRPSLEGMRCLDVGTADGFWAFEMERRGAAEVVAVDVGDTMRWDWPGNTPRTRQVAFARDVTDLKDGFEIAHHALESKVKRLDSTVYELSPEVVGEFDFVFVGSMLLHVRDPVAAIAAVGSVLRGELLSVDAISPPLTLLHPWQPIARLEAHGHPMWWAMNLKTYRRLFDAAGLEIIESGSPFFVKRGLRSNGGAPHKASSLYQRVRTRAISRVGILHAWVRAQPKSAAG
jgi:tRNA (mo5U34)-methyltransferase